MSAQIHRFPERPRPLQTWVDERRVQRRRERLLDACWTLAAALLWFATAWLMALAL